MEKAKSATRMITYQWCHVSHDDKGNKITGLRETLIYVRYCGSRERVFVGSVPYPENEFRIPVSQDGVIVAYHRHQGDRLGEFSPGLVIEVNILPPAKPDPGEAYVMPAGDIPDAIIVYGWAYPCNDTGGSRLHKIQGCEVQVQFPDDACTWKTVGFVETDLDELQIPTNQDGPHRIRHAIRGACELSDWSDPIPVDIDMRPPAAGERGKAKVPCALSGDESC